MNFRITLVLVVVAVLLGGYLWFGPPLTEPEDNTSPTSQDWFYLVDDFLINRLDASYFGTEATFVRDSERVWYYGSFEGPPVSEEFAGTPFLAGGARSPRLIMENPDDEALRLYGLDSPQITLRLYLETGEAYTVSIGDLTPDRITNYARIDGIDRVYLLDRTWGEHMARLITEQDIFVSTPTPTSDPNATPSP